MAANPTITVQATVTGTIGNLHIETVVLCGGGCGCPRSECECPEDTDERWPCENVWCDNGNERPHSAHHVEYMKRNAHPSVRSSLRVGPGMPCPDCGGTGWVEE